MKKFGVGLQKSVFSDIKIQPKLYDMGTPSKMVLFAVISLTGFSALLKNFVQNTGKHIEGKILFIGPRSPNIFRRRPPHQDCPPHTIYQIVCYPY